MMSMSIRANIEYTPETAGLILALFMLGPNGTLVVAFRDLKRSPSQAIYDDPLVIESGNGTPSF
jgi:hypothetical protein